MRKKCSYFIKSESFGEQGRSHSALKLNLHHEMERYYHITQDELKVSKHLLLHSLGQTTC